MKVFHVAIVATGLALAPVLGSAAEKGEPMAGSTTTGSRAGNAQDPRLTGGQQRMIYQNIVNAERQALQEEVQVAVGLQLPASISLKPLPGHVVRQVPSVEGLNYAKLESDDVLLADPSTRVVRVIITKDEGGLTQKEREPDTSGQSPSK